MVSSHAGLKRQSFSGQIEKRQALVAVSTDFSE